MGPYLVDIRFNREIIIANVINCFDNFIRNRKKNITHYTYLVTFIFSRCGPGEHGAPLTIYAFLSRTKHCMECFILECSRLIYVHTWIYTRVQHSQGYQHGEVCVLKHASIKKSMYVWFPIFPEN